jgi:hypothetical protein
MTVGRLAVRSIQASAGSTEAGIGTSVSHLGESHLGAQLTNDAPS